MISRWTLSAALLLLPLPLCAQLRPQSRFAVAPFAAWDGALPGRPLVVGASVARYSDALDGAFGVRAGLGVARRSTPAGTAPRPGDGAWTTDVDAVVAPARLPGLGFLAGADPRLFVGAGVESAIGEAAERATQPTWSWGAGGSWRLAGWLSADVEARRRSAFLSGPAAGFEGGWEARAGLSLRLGHVGTGRTFRGPSAPPPAAPPIPSAPKGDDAGAAAVAYRAIEDGRAFLGTPYVWGGSDPGEGFDCSGFVQYIFREEGVRLPRTSRQMARVGEDLPARVDALRPGDLMFFSSDGDGVDHVALYAGDGWLLHSSSSGKGVRYDPLSGPRGRWFLDHLVAARRVVGEPSLAGAAPMQRDRGLVGEPVEYDRGDRAPAVGSSGGPGGAGPGGAGPGGPGRR